MTSNATTVDQYMDELPEDRKKTMMEMRKTILKNIPKGFKEQISYGMIGYVVPHSLYPGGYHCEPKLPLPFVAFASQKNFIAFYHMGVYAMPELLKWFVDEYAKQSATKLDMGKSCVRFKKPEHIPFKLIGELMKKVTVNDWITVYEGNLKR
jgi:uncharacterized protein YdhG (YjbR/CyaY superfamily)